MTDDELRAQYAVLRAQRERARAEAGSTPAPDPALIAAALAGEGDEASRIRVLDDALRTGVGDDVAFAHTLHTAAVVASSSAGAKRASFSVQRWWPMAAAAVVIATVGVVQWRETGGNDAVRYRDGGTGTPMLVAPAADAPIDSRTVFVWRAVADARSYALETLDANGAVIARVVTSDTTTVMPAGTSAGVRQTITGWWVIATTRDGATTRSALRLVAPAQRP